MKIKGYLKLSWVLLLGICFAQQKQEVKSYKFSIGEERLNFSKIFDEINYIKLESVADVIIGEVNRIEIFDNKIFIMDSYQSKSLFIYDIKGKFINSICRIGEGPGEFKEISDFHINKDDRTIEIFDIDLRKVITFDWECNFLKEFSYKGFFNKIYKIDKENYILTQNYYGAKETKYNYRQMNNSGEIIGNFNFINEKFMSFPYANQCSRIDEKIWVVPRFENNIYKVENQKLTKLMTFDFGTRDLTEKLISEKNITMNEILKGDYFHSLNNIHKFGNKLFFTISKNRSLFSVFLDLDSGKYFSGKIINNDIDFTPFALFVGEYENNLIGYIDPFTAMEIKKSAPKEYLDILPEFIKEMNEDSAIVIALCKVKVIDKE